MTEASRFAARVKSARALCTELGIEASLLGVGVDRLDYTKGISNDSAASNASSN